ncbi:MAG: sodium:alanine symporter family protein [Rikenellaceae bacterium]
MYESINHLLEVVNGWLWGWPMIIILFGCHLFLTIRLRFPQRYIFKAIRLSVTRDDRSSEGDVSQFGALVTSLAATIGTGNIIGVATAIALGGPGAVLWCWMSGFLGIATKYAEALLSVKYRVRGDKGTMIGGPMYALERGLNMKWMGMLFCVVTLMASFGIGNTVQSNAMAMVITENTGVSLHIVGVVIALLVGVVIFTGIKGIAKVCSQLVPIMAIAYVAGCVWIMVINWAYLWPAISLIFESAFTPQAAGGGFVGSAVIAAARFGIARGLFSNESGLGSAPIVAAAAKSRNPVRQALVSSTGTFWDTVVICAITGIVLVSSVLANPDIDSTVQGGMLTQMAFSQIPYIGTTILTVGIATFAFSTILGWGYYAERAVEYLSGTRYLMVFRVVWVVMIYFGAILNLSIVWNFSDIMNAMMALPNILSLVLLSGVAVNETRKFLWEGRLDEYSHDDESLE